MSYVGTPLATDRLTGHRTKLDFARVLVDIKSNSILPEFIPVKGPGGTFQQKVLYECDMKKCTQCGMVGHEYEQCRRRKILNRIDEKSHEVSEGTSQVRKEVTDGKPKCTHCGLRNHTVENCWKKKAMEEKLVPVESSKIGEPIDGAAQTEPEVIDMCFQANEQHAHY